MAKHLVKCPKCGQTFDTNTEQAVKIGARRYGHANCYPDSTDFVPMEIKQEDKDLVALKAYITKLYGDKANWILINKQIKDFQKDYQYSLSGMLKSLIWFYEVKGNTPEKSNGGIGIIPYAYQDAYNYYYSLFVAQSQNATVNIQEITNRVKEVVIPPPEIKTPIRLFNLEDENDD